MPQRCRGSERPRKPKPPPLDSKINDPDSSWNTRSSFGILIANKTLQRPEVKYTVLDDNAPRVENFFKRLKNNRIIAPIAIVVILIIGMGTLTDSVDKVIKFSTTYLVKRPSVKQDPSKKDVDLKPTLSRNGVPIPNGPQLGASPTIAQPRKQPEPKAPNNSPGRPNSESPTRSGVGVSSIQQSSKQDIGNSTVVTRLPQAETPAKNLDLTVPVDNPSPEKPTVNSPPQVAPAGLKPLAQSFDPSCPDAEALNQAFTAASTANVYSAQDTLYDRVIENALCSYNYKVAMAAAHGMNVTSLKDNAYIRIIKSALSQRNFAVANEASDKIQVYSTQDAAKKLIVEAAITRDNAVIQTPPQNVAAPHVQSKKPNAEVNAIDPQLSSAVGPSPDANVTVRGQVQAIHIALAGQTMSSREASVASAQKSLPDDLTGHEIALLLGSESMSTRTSLLKILVSRTQKNSISPESVPAILANETMSTRESMTEIIVPYIAAPIAAEAAVKILGRATDCTRTRCLRYLAPIIKRPITPTDVNTLLNTITGSCRSDAIASLFGH
jgi:hypothetical protein